MHRDYPYVGHDYRYFILRMIDTKLFLLLNGPTIQWYTPSFGGGLPAYPNPQHIQYSVVQFFTLIMNPWMAVLASTFIITFAGFMAFVQFLEKVMQFHWTSSTLGAIFFIGNGFFIEHMIVGHIGHQLFPIGALALNATLNGRYGLAKGAAVVALVLAMMIHQTGFYLILILALSFLMLLPLLRLYDPEFFSPDLALRKLVFGSVLAAVIAGSKIYAVMSLMQLFPRVVEDYYPVGILQGLIGLAAQLLGAMFFVPFLLLARQDISQLSGSLSNVTGAYFGIWETDIGLSPVLIILLLFSLARLISRARKKPPAVRRASGSVFAWLILLIGVWMTMELTLSRGLIYPYIKGLPILRSMHVNVRFAAAFILPLILVGVKEYEILSRARPRQSLFASAAGLAMLSLFTYNLFPSDVHSRHYDLTRSLQTDSAIRHGERFPVEQVADVEEEAVFLEHATSLLDYEPLFSDHDRVKGYILKDTVAIQVRPGPVTETDGAYFNMTNPASLVFPRQNGLQPFERIRIDEEQELRAFVQRRQPGWKIPKAQVILNWVSLGSLVLAIYLAVFHEPLKKLNSPASQVRERLAARKRP
ncbi:MAG TPA: hypothetical protein VFO91_17135 [Anaerolineales bacterium]|nr:hypothetical protein [Anaerolineales bacterium]